MGKVFRPYDPEQQFLLPPSLSETKSADTRIALGNLFLQVLEACRAAGLVKYAKAIREWLDRSDREDDEDDHRLGADKRGDELPEHLRTKQERLEKIEQALRDNSAKPSWLPGFLLTRTRLVSRARREQSQSGPRYLGPRIGCMPSRPPQARM